MILGFWPEKPGIEWRKSWETAVFPADKKVIEKNEKVLAFWNLL